jgi:hypothetical protein
VKLISKRSAAFAAAIAAFAVVPAAGTAGADSEPTATAAKACKDVNTRNGGRAGFIRTSGPVSCRLARRVAAASSGRKKYSARGFDCTGRKSAISEYRLLYGCGAVKNGRGVGVGFYWKKR